MTKIIDQYSLDESIGQDAYGFDIYKARHIKQGELYTVRNVSNVAYTSANFFQDAVKNQVNILKKVVHANLVTFVKMFKTANNIYLVYEYCSGGTLFDRVCSSQLTETQQNNYIRQLQQGIQQLHNSNIAHLNLNPRTIFIGVGGALKIGNFAHARDLNDCSADYDVSRMKHTDFLAAEQLNKQPASLKTDIYSLGLIFAFIKHGKRESSEALLIENSKSKDLISETIQSMVLKDTSKRIDIDSVKTSMGLGGVASKKSSSPSHIVQRQSIRRSSDERTPMRGVGSKHSPGKDSSLNGSVANKSNNSLLVPTSKKNLKADRQFSDAKSYFGNEEENSDNSLTKRIYRQRNKYNYMIQIARDIASQELATNSSKLSFVVAKKAFTTAIRLKSDLIQSKDKAAVAEDFALLMKIVLKQIEDVQNFYKQLKNWVRTQQKKLLSDSAFQLQTEEDETLNEAFLRKLIKEYVNNIFPKIDPLKRDDQQKTRHLLQHVNNLSDVQQLDRFFTNFINDSVANLLEQVYFDEVKKMELRDLHRFVAEKISG